MELEVEIAIESSVLRRLRLDTPRLIFQYVCHETTGHLDMHITIHVGDGSELVRNIIIYAPRPLDDELLFLSHPVSELCNDQLSTEPAKSTNSIVEQQTPAPPPVNAHN